MPTTRQRALWENVQQAKRKGLSLRAIARGLVIHRNTLRKYALAESPPLRKRKGLTRDAAASDGDVYLNGHNRWTSTCPRVRDFRVAIAVGNSGIGKPHVALGQGLAAC